MIKHFLSIKEYTTLDNKKDPLLTWQDFMISIHQICLSLWTGNFRGVKWLTVLTSERKERGKAKKGWRQRKHLRTRRKAERHPRKEASPAAETLWERPEADQTPGSKTAERHGGRAWLLCLPCYPIYEPKLLTGEYLAMQ